MGRMSKKEKKPVDVKLKAHSRLRCSSGADARRGSLAAWAPMACVHTPILAQHLAVWNPRLHQPAQTLV